MKIYPDLLNNPNNDPRTTQEQYENWYAEISRRDWEREIYRQCDEEAAAED